MVPPRELTVRRAVPADASAIQALYMQLVSSPGVSVLPGRIAQIAEDPNTALFVCESHGVIIGTVLVSLCADVMFQNQPFGVVENIVVDASARSLGVGAALIREVESFCYHAQCSKIMLMSSAERAEAHRFFERAGFTGSAKRGFVKYRRQFRECHEGSCPSIEP